MKIYAAPMAGITDYSFRKILEKFNPDFLFTEMVNANLLNREDDVTINELLKCDAKEKTGTQIFGGNKEELVSGILKLKNFGFKKININMGCPQPKIIKNGAGSALLENYELVEQVLSETQNIGAEISIKIRIGYKDFENPEIFLNLVDKYNLDFICIHGRTQKQMYSGTANWEIIEKLSKIPRKIEFFGNGDLFEPLEIKKKISSSNLDGIILSRGIIGNPWLITQTREFLQTGKIATIQTFNETKAIVLEHLQNITENKGEMKAVLEINKFLRPYFKKFWEKNLDRNSETSTIENYYNENLKEKINKIILEKKISKKIKMIEML